MTSIPTNITPDFNSPSNPYKYSKLNSFSLALFPFCTLTGLLKQFVQLVYLCSPLLSCTCWIGA